MCYALGEVSKMFYNRNNQAYAIQDIFRVTRKKGSNFYTGRDFSGLAFRFSGSSVIKYANKKTNAVTGSITYIPAGLDFEVESEPEEVIILHLTCFGNEPTDILSLTFQNTDKFADLFLSMFSEWQQRKPGYQNRCTALLYTLFEQMEKADAKPDNPKAELIRKGVLYMNMHYADASLTIPLLSEKCNISEVYFRKLFKELYGISPAKALLKLRIEHAVRLLESGYYRVSEVAQMSGFSDVKYFSTAFKKETGHAPTEIKM